MSDTIAAIATAPVQSAIGIIRVSGDDAISVSEKIFRANGKKTLSQFENYKMGLGSLCGPDGAVIDICLAVVSRASGSYTGEDTVEFHTHGSPMVLAQGLSALFSAGARQALPGEYTKRAFLNGKMDLAQAEAVIDLISAETAQAAQNAAGQIGGAISRKVDGVYDELVDIVSHYHAVVDYPDEDIEPFELLEFSAILKNAADRLERLLQTFDRGRIIKDGVKSAILGRPNAGKSSLLNALLGYDRAIVTPIAGTTRDTIEESVRLGGILLRLSDTAGIRQTVDAIEEMGVNRALSAAREAELVLVILDGSAPLQKEDYDAMEAAGQAPRKIAVINKSDLELKLDLSQVTSRFERVCVVSALDGTGLDELGDAVSGLFPGGEAASCDGGILTNARQAGAVARAKESLLLAISSMESGQTPDAVLVDVEEALEALGEVTGKTMREDITARIFERFCVGK